MEQMTILEYNEQDGGFHYNLMEYVSGTRGYKAVSLCSYALAMNFTSKYNSKRLSYNEICRQWELYYNAHRNEFLKIGLK